MSNITISIKDELLKESRRYTKKHNTSLNALIRKLLSKTVISSSNDWFDECFDLMNKANGNSKGKKWKREELYDV